MSLEYLGGGPVLVVGTRLSKAEIAARRVAGARRVKLWREVDETHVVKRGHWLLDTTTDELCTVYRGEVFGPDGGIAFAAGQPLLFYVDQSGNVQFLEQVGRTWSEQQERNR